MPKTPLWKLNCRLGLHPAVVHSFGDEYTRYQYVCEYKCGWHAILDLEAGRTLGTVQTLERLLGVVGLRLGVQRIISHEAGAVFTPTPVE